MKHLLHALSPLLSRRLVMTFLGLYILRNSFWGIVTGLDGFTDANKVTAYTTMSSWYFSAVAALVMAYVGVTSWKGGMTVASALQASLSAESVTQDITERIYNLDKLDPKDIPDADSL